MRNLLSKPVRGSAFSRVLLTSFLIALLSALLPATGLADPPAPGQAGSEKCAGCHSAETEAWQQSPHAQALVHIEGTLQAACSPEAVSDECSCMACHTTDFNPAESTYDYGGVACEACHGAYVEGHPKDGVMELDVDSSVCRDCHVETHAQWQDSPHAEAGVQCIGCHMSHSQDFRLTDEALCGACHRGQLEDFSHTAHENAEVGCTDCHLSSAPVDQMNALASTEMSFSHSPAPSHTFTVVSSQACVDCHGQTIHQEAPGDNVTQAANVRLLALAERAPELATQLDAAERTIRSLRVMAMVSLGLGMGIGAMLGIVSMLVLGYIMQGRTKR